MAGYNIHKPIVAIMASTDIGYLNIGRYIHPEHCAKLFIENDTFADSIIKIWAKNNELETVDFKVFDFGDHCIEYGQYMRDIDMVNGADVTILFWSGRHDNIYYVYQYCKLSNHKVIIHFVKD